MRTKSKINFRSWKVLNRDVNAMMRPKPGLSLVIYSLLCILLMHLPLVVVVHESFVEPIPFDSGAVNLETGLSTWKYGISAYVKAFSNEQLLEALGLSLLLALATAVGSTVLGIMGALALEWGKDLPGRKFLDGITLMPLVMPELVLGISLLICFVMVGLELGFVTLLLAHISFTISYTIVTIRSSLEQMDPAIEEAAFDLGARPSQIFWRVIFPMITPAILSAMVMAFTLSFDDFMVSFFTTGVGSDPLPLKLYSMIKLGVNPEVCALSTVIIFFTLVLLLGLQRFRRGGQLS